jgi:hypothetical protein
VDSGFMRIKPTAGSFLSIRPVFTFSVSPLPERKNRGGLKARELANSSR